MGRIKLKNIGIGILTGYGMTLVLLFLLALVMVFTSLGEGALDTLVAVANFLGIWFAGFWSVRHITSGGWLIGGITGVLCPLILRLIGAIIYDGTYLTPQLIPALLLGFVPLAGLPELI
ncbi:MAG: TIGR04086 family membrane protein [Ruminococcaceae bacterium]|nr:TIGR04086 family membrane protein [Oscillospiraceae bacterium]